MSPELDKRLVDAFPNLYRQRYLSPRETCMCWGFPGDGWFQLIYDLSEKLERMILALPEDEREHCSASQVKEKYGTLQFYMSAETDEMTAAIQEAEDRSSITCETCGAPGKLRGKGWLYTACELHVQ